MIIAVLGNEGKANKMQLTNGGACVSGVVEWYGGPHPGSSIESRSRYFCSSEKAGVHWLFSCAL